jgi:HSP20 family protein
MAQQPRFGQLFVAASRSFRKTQWQPSVDAYQTRDGWLLKYELAGVVPEEVAVAVSGRTVAIRGIRRDVWIEERQQSQCMEISYNQFERALELPCDLEAMTVTTDYRDGMLIVRLRCKVLPT